MTDIPMKPDWQAAFPYSHELYEQEMNDVVDAQRAYLAKQKEPGFIIPGWESWVMNNLPPNDPVALRLKWAIINPNTPFPEEVQS